MGLVRGRRVRPKVTVSPEIVALFPSADSPPDFESRYLEKFYAWCECNRDRDFSYDYAHRPGGIRIGRLLNDLDFETSGKILRTYSSVSHVLLES